MLQDYGRNTRFQLGTKRTASLLYLRVANTTYVPSSPRVRELRVSERTILTESTPQCGKPESQDLCLESTAIIDGCAAGISCSHLAAGYVVSTDRSALCFACACHWSGVLQVQHIMISFDGNAHL